MYAGPFLGECYSEWAEMRRRELENGHLRILFLLADHHAARGDTSRAAALLEKYIAIDPYEDEAYCRMMRWHLAKGNKPLALRVYQQYMDLLAGNKVNQSSEIRELYGKLVAVG